MCTGGAQNCTNIVLLNLTHTIVHNLRILCLEYIPSWNPNMFAMFQEDDEEEKGDVTWDGEEEDAISYAVPFEEEEFIEDSYYEEGYVNPYE